MQDNVELNLVFKDEVIKLLKNMKFEPALFGFSQYGKIRNDILDDVITIVSAMSPLEIEFDTRNIKRLKIK